MCHQKFRVENKFGKENMCHQKFRKENVSSEIW
jgi:hypothetical protein